MTCEILQTVVIFKNSRIAATIGRHEPTVTGRMPVTFFRLHDSLFFLGYCLIYFILVEVNSPTKLIGRDETLIDPVFNRSLADG